MVFGIDDIIIGAGQTAADIANTNATNQTNMNIATTNNAFNASEAEKARNYNTSMSNTAYQRASADMKAAGLNPMLAYQQGGASSPTSPAASSSGNPTMLKSNWLQSALQSVRELADTKKAISGTSLQDSQTSNTQQDTLNKKATEQNIKADTQYKVNSANTANLTNQKLQLQQTENQNSQTISELIKQTLSGILKPMKQNINSGTSVIREANDFWRR